MSEAKKRPVGRPLKEIDWGLVDNLCMIQCTGEEICSVLNIDYDTLNNHCNREFKVNFSDYYLRKKGRGKVSLRRAQWLTATEDRNPSLLIWLGKNVLDQTDRQDHKDVDGLTTQLKDLIDRLPA